jgi:hypothetical protein
MSNQKPEAARQNIDSGQRLSVAIAAPASTVDYGQETRVQQHLGRHLPHVAGQRFADWIGEQVERGAGFALTRLDHGVEPSDARIVEGVDEAFGFGVDGPRDLPVHHRDDLPGDDAEDDAGPERAQQEDRQREAKGGGAKELTERRHVSYNRRREPC